MALVPFAAGALAPTVSALAPVVSDALMRAGTGVANKLAQRVAQRAAASAQEAAVGWVQRGIPDFFSRRSSVDTARFGAPSAKRSVPIGSAPVYMYSNAGIRRLTRGAAARWRGMPTYRALRLRHRRQYRRRYRRYRRY